MGLLWCISREHVLQQLLLVYLAHRVARDGVYHRQPRGGVVRRHLVGAPAGQCAHVQRWRALTHAEHRTDQLPAYVIGDAEHGALPDVGVLEQLVLDVERRYLRRGEDGQPRSATTRT